MKKSIVFIGSSAGEGKIAKVMSTLWKANIEVESYCVLAKDAKKIKKELKKYHEEMLKDPDAKGQKIEDVENAGNEQPAKAKKLRKTENPNKAKAKRKKQEKKAFKKLAKTVGAKTKEQKRQLKKDIKEGVRRATEGLACFKPFGDEGFESLEDFFEFIN